MLGLALILLGYLLPHLVRSRQLLLQSRLEDRFSAGLRVLPVTAEGRSAGGAHHGGAVARPYLHPPRTEAAVNRPTTRGARAEEDARALAAARAARAAEISRRAAAARRRLALTLVLLVGAVAAWAAVGLASLGWWVAALPTVLLGGVLVLGRRAAVAGQRRNAQARAEMARLEARLRATAHAEAEPSGAAARVAARRRAAADRTAAERTAAANVTAPDTAVPAADTAPHDAPAARPADDETAPAVVVPSGAEAVEAADDEAAPAVVVPAVTESPAEAAAAAADAAQDDEESDREERPWTPVAVPPPTYTLKPAARRRDVAPYEADPQATAAVPVRPGAPASSAVSAASPAAAPAQAPRTPEADETQRVADAPSLDLDAVLMRRRAAGA